MRLLHAICLVLTILGALNWGLWGLFQTDLVAVLFGGQVGRMIYLVIGLAGLILIYTSAVIYERLRGFRRWSGWWR